MRYGMPGLAFLIATGLAACASSPDEVAPGESFTLAPGTEAIVKGGGPRVRFEGVLEDSRCPSDVQCIWAGEVVVDVTIGDGSSSRRSMRPGEAVASGRFRVNLLEVQPYPKSTSAIQPSQYRATFLVDTQP